MANPGDKVKVTTTDKVVEGVLMPNEETDSVIVKMKSGYNIGIKKSKVKKIDVVSEAKPLPTVKGSIKNNPKLPTIAILHTGGTIASKVDYTTGGVVARFSPEEILGLFPELYDIANIRSRMVCKMMSENMRFLHYKEMIKAVQEEIKAGVDGVIIAHGTDAMHYTAAALSFALEGLSVPVILVGAQRSSDRGSSDAGMNLVSAAHFISKSDYAGVAICMHDNMEDTKCAINPPVKTKKMHTSRRDAFKAIGDKPIAIVDYEKGKIDMIAKDLPESSKLIVKDNFEDKVGIVRCHPNMHPEEFSCFKGFKGLVIEGTGLGHAPVIGDDDLTKVNEKNFKALTDLIKSGTTVVMTSQCTYGAVHMHVYSAGVKLLKAGVIPCHDTLTETAFVKLAWLLGNKLDVKLMGENLRGEIKERVTTEFIDE